MRTWIPLSAALLALVPASAWAADGTDGTSPLIAIAAALAVGLPTVGGALAQGRATARAVEGVGRNPASAPKVTTPLVVGLALIESQAMFGLLVALMLVGLVR